jgi:flagellar export protein FliJ
MKPFAFRLESVLTIWRRREEAALTFLQQQQAATAAAHQRITVLDARRSDARAALASVSGGVPSIDDPAWHRNWITRMTMALEAARADAARCVANEAAARAAWQKARRDMRVMERLRERAHRRYTQEARRDERKQMDELAVVGAFRKGGLTW